LAFQKRWQLLILLVRNWSWHSTSTHHYVFTEWYQTFGCKCRLWLDIYVYSHTHTQKGKTNLDFTEARDSEWQWHQLGRMQVCTLLQTDNYASTSPLGFLQAGCPSCRPTNSVKVYSLTIIIVRNLGKEVEL